MSHFTHIKTRFQNLSYLEKALSKLNIAYKQEQKLNNSSKSFDINLVIPQSNGYNIEFSWNGQDYDLIVDMSFWEQPYPIENFITKISQKYAGEVIMSESQKMGFEPVNYQHNSDGSKILVLERWNNEK